MATKSITGINGPMDLYVIQTVDGRRFPVRTEHIYAGSIEQAREVARRIYGPFTSVKKG